VLAVLVCWLEICLCWPMIVHHINVALFDPSIK
jgi:hypothetical protein